MPSNTWHVETNSINGDPGTRAESDVHPSLNDRDVWEFRVGEEITLLVPNHCVTYIKRIR